VTLRYLLRNSRNIAPRLGELVSVRLTSAGDRVA
jgi:hypothetical protein